MDCVGNLVLAARSITPDLPSTPEALQRASAGGADALLIQFDPTGAVTSLSYFGGEKDDGATAIALDLDGRIYIAGYTNSAALPGLPQIGADQRVFTSTLRTSLPACR